MGNSQLLSLNFPNSHQPHPKIQQISNILPTQIYDKKVTIVQQNPTSIKRQKVIIGSTKITNFAKPKIPVVTTVLNNHDKNLLKKINDVGYKRIERRGVGDWKKIYNSTNRFKSRSDFKVKAIPEDPLDQLHNELQESAPILCSAVKRLNLVRSLILQSTSNLNLTYARLERIRQFLTDNPTAHTATKNQLLINLTNNSAPIQTIHDTSDTIGFFPSEHNPVFTIGNYPPRGKNVQKLDKGFDYQNYKVSGGVLVAQNKRLDGLERKFFPEGEEKKEEEGEDVIF